MPIINYYNEGATANAYITNWNRSDTYTQSSITGLGTVTLHGPSSGAYVFNLSNLPAHAKIRYEVFWHFVDSLDNEISSLYIEGTEWARFTKTGFPGAGEPGAPSYIVNRFDSVTWNPVTYSDAPWSPGTSTADGYVAFDTGFFDHTASTFTATHNLGHDQGQSDEAMYLSHVKVTLYQVSAEIPTNGMYLRLDAANATSFPGKQEFLFQANLTTTGQTVNFSHYHVGGNLPGPLVLLTTTTRPPRTTTTTSTTSTTSTSTTTTEPPLPVNVQLKTNYVGTVLAHQKPFITIDLSVPALGDELALEDVLVAGPGTLSTFAYAGSTLASFLLNPIEDKVGIVSMFIPSSSFRGVNNSFNDRSNTLNFTVDTVRPLITVSTDNAAIKIGETANITFTTSNATTNFSSIDVTFTGPGTLTDFAAISSTVYKATLTADTNVAGQFTVNVAADTFSNSIGNRNKPSNILTIPVDTRYPSMVIESTDMSFTYGETATITFTSNIPTVTFELANVTIVGPGTLSNFEVLSQTEYRALLTPTGDGTIGIRVQDNSYISLAGNPNTESANLEIVSAVTTSTTTSTSTSTTSTSTSTTTTTIPPAAPGEVIFDQPGGYSFTVPAGVTSVSVVVVGGGGGSVNFNSIDTTDDQPGGGGGGLAYRNNIAVTPNEVILIIVGAGGGPASNGGNSYFKDSTFLHAYGGEVGQSSGVGGAGGNYVGEGGGVGGVGGSCDGGNSGGGGGAGGYLGQGGNGAGINNSFTAFAGSGGGGGGGGSGNSIAGPGGGVGIFGLGTNGVAGDNSETSTSAGGGGSGGTPGIILVGGGVYGGGGTGNDGSHPVTPGGRGVVRVIWPGNTRQFPSTNVSMTPIDFSITATCVNTSGIRGSYTVTNLTGAYEYEISSGFSTTAGDAEDGPWYTGTSLTKNAVADGTYYVTVRDKLFTSRFTTKSIVINCPALPLTGLMSILALEPIYIAQPIGSVQNQDADNDPDDLDDFKGNLSL